MPFPLVPPAYTLVVIDRDQPAFARARALLGQDVEDGTLVYADRRDRLDLALILEPDADTATTLLVTYAFANAVADALAARVPPLMAVTVRWPATILVDGAELGRIRLAIEAAPSPDQPPATLVLGVVLDLVESGDDPGLTPDRTSLAGVGADDTSPAALAESIARHFLTWVNTLEAEGFGPVRQTWNARCHQRGQAGTFEFGEWHYSGEIAGIDPAGWFRIGQHGVPLTAVLDSLA